MATTDDPQRRAAVSPADDLLVVAPPGCGKTEVLAMRAAALIPRLRPHQRILALTFTNRAKANLSQRLRRLLGPQRFRRYVQVHNFHGHAADVIRSHGRTLGLDPAELTFPTTQTLRKALRQLSTDPGANRAAEQLLGEIKRELRDDDEVLAMLAAAGDALAVRVEQERIAAGQLHYDDLLRHAQRLLRIDQVANLYQQHYGAVLVDEFQDLSLQQLDVVLRTCTRSRTFAGDPLQGIYSWAGAAPAAVEAQLEALCGDPLQLTVSYRSSPAVLNMLNSVTVPMGAEPLRAHDPASWPGAGASAALSFDSYQDEARSICAFARQIIISDPSASVGIISRSGWRRGESDKMFAADSTLPCRRWDLAIDDPLVLDRIRKVVATLPVGASVATARDAALAAVDPSDVDTTEDLDHAFDQLASEVGGTASVRSALARFSHSDSQGDVDGPVGPGVHLLNAHTGKGQQFDWVFIPGLEEKHIPDRRSAFGAALAEEQRVLLVMLSRARHGVVVSRSKNADGRYGPYRVEPSRWFAGLEQAASLTATTLTAHVNHLYPQSR